MDFSFNLLTISNLSFNIFLLFIINTLSLQYYIKTRIALGWESERERKGWEVTTHVCWYQPTPILLFVIRTYNSTLPWQIKHTGISLRKTITANIYHLNWFTYITCQGSLINEIICNFIGKILLSRNYFWFHNRPHNQELRPSTHDL